MSENTSRLIIEPSEKFFENQQKEAEALLQPWDTEDSNFHGIKSPEDYIISQEIYDEWNKCLASKNKTMLFSGPPGTGKSTIIKALIKVELEKNPEGKFYYICFTKSTDYVDFIEGTHMGKNGWEFTNGILMEACHFAYTHPNVPVFLFIDEINRAKCEEVFGEAMAAITIRGSKVITKNKRSIVIPENLVIVAARNTFDKGADELGEAFLERFHEIIVDPCWTRDYIAKFSDTDSKRLIRLIEIVDGVNKKLKESGHEQYQIGTRILNKALEANNEVTNEIVMKLAKDIHSTLRNRINKGAKSRLEVLSELEKFIRE